MGSMPSGPLVCSLLERQINPPPPPPPPPPLRPVRGQLSALVRGHCSSSTHQPWICNYDTVTLSLRSRYTR